MRKESSEVFQKEQEDIIVVPRSSTLGEIREVNGVMLLTDPIFREKLVKCFDMLLKNTNYLKEVKFYSQDHNRISMGDILNFIDDVSDAGQLIERSNRTSGGELRNEASLPLHSQFV